MEMSQGCQVTGRTPKSEGKLARALFTLEAGASETCSEPGVCLELAASALTTIAKCQGSAPKGLVVTGLRSSAVRQPFGTLQCAFPSQCIMTSMLCFLCFSLAVVVRVSCVPIGQCRTHFCRSPPRGE